MVKRFVYNSCTQRIKSAFVTHITNLPHILLDVLAPEVYLPAVVPAPAAPLGLLISKPEAVVPPACNGTSSYGQSPDYSKTCEASVWCYVTSQQDSDVCRREPAVG